MASVIKVDTIKSTTGNTALTISESGVPQLNVPAFRAYMSADQSVTSAAVTRVNIDTKTGDGYFDTDDWFDTTNNRYVPQIAGYYQFNGTVRVDGTSQSLQAAYFLKNGASVSAGVINRVSASVAVTVTISSLMYLNGSTDYVELAGQVAATSPKFDYVSAPFTCVFEGFLVRAA